MKAVLISIKSKHVLDILNGDKTLELRKRVPKDFVGWVYVYVTKGKRLSVVHDDEIVKTYYYLNSNWGRELNQDIPCRFWFDEYEKYGNTDLYSYTYRHRIDKLLKNACITTDDLYKYIKKVKIEEETKYRKYYPFYAWHIKKLEIFDYPMQLSDFYSQSQIKKDWLEYKNRCGDFTPLSKQQYFKHYYRNPDKVSITKAPRSYQYVWVKE